MRSLYRRNNEGKGRFITILYLDDGTSEECYGDMDEITNGLNGTTLPLDPERFVVVSPGEAGEAPFVDPVIGMNNSEYVAEYITWDGCTHNPETKGWFLYDKRTCLACVPDEMQGSFDTVCDYVREREEREEEQRRNKRNTKPTENDEESKI